MSTNTVQQYKDSDTGRARWAVLHGPSRCWYFPTRYGRAAAEKLARERNAQDRAYAGLDNRFNAALTALTRNGK